MNALQWWSQGDVVTQTTAVFLLLMSVASWVVLLFKLRLLWRARRDVARCTAAFWQAPDLEVARQRLQAWDREGVVLPLVVAAYGVAHAPSIPTLAHAVNRSQHITRVLRDALHLVLGQLQSGQVLLATVGSTAPFVGLLGTVWGVFHALTALSGGATISMDQISGPVGEALVMTAAGLAVAIPAVLGYNVLGRTIARIEADLEGFAFDLRELLGSPASAPAGDRPSTDAAPPP